MQVGDGAVDEAPSLGRLVDEASRRSAPRLHLLWIGFESLRLYDATPDEAAVQPTSIDVTGRIRAVLPPTATVERIDPHTVAVLLGQSVVSESSESTL